MSLAEGLIRCGFVKVDIQLVHEASASVCLPAFKAELDKYTLSVVVNEPFLMILEIKEAYIAGGVPEKILARLDDQVQGAEEVLELASFVYEEVVDLMKFSNN